MRDPNHESSGGVERLREAGIVVELAYDPGLFASLNEGWLKRLATGVPFVTAKLGLSLDAHGALRAGERASITGASGAQVTQLLRSNADAVAVSAATVIADNPSLTVRDCEGRLASRQPLRVVLARQTTPPADSAVFTDGLAETKVVIRLWIVSGILALLALATIKIR
jgi:diaminohydroxyphosphoribosylaminopyrimidine deaminase/5-amino-6-(5-phosphoribosylamino)uracil reductase